MNRASIAYAELWRTTLLTALGLAPLACAADEGPQGAPCGSSTAIENSGGLARCETGLVHRAAPESCANHFAEIPEPSPGTVLRSNSDSDTLHWCTTHADCTARSYGHCVPVQGGDAFGAYCEYGCVVDNDCGAGAICLCGTSIGRCSPSDCATDADCGSGLKCLGSEVGQCDAPPVFACETNADTKGAEATCGRPFLVAGEPRLASLARTGDWNCEQPAPRLNHLSDDERMALGRWWANAGSMEHASVAAFARFTLQLLQLGAPSELVAASVAATADETLHARLAFTLASAYLGQPTGPGPLPVNDSLTATTLREVTLLVLHEGCLGETIATLEAGHALERESDPVVRYVLARIHDDERRHAELAWRFVRWALDTAPELASELKHEIAALSQDRKPCAARINGAQPQGLVSAADSAALRKLALQKVVLPCAQALLTEALLTEALLTQALLTQTRVAQYAA